MSQHDPSFPSLSKQDTYRKPTHLKRAVGDSRRKDGAIWSAGVTGGTSHVVGSLSSASEPSSSTVNAPIATQAIRRKRRAPPPEETVSNGKRARVDMPPPNQAGASIAADTEEIDGKKAPKADGWIWSFRPRGGMSDEDVEKWMIEGDRVQWFRAEAEMERWREEWEIKQADFLRCIRSFNKMSSVWEEMARESIEGGKRAYAKHKSALFKEMERHAKKLFSDAGYGHLIEHLLDHDEGKILADYIILERSDPKYDIPQLTVKVLAASGFPKSVREQISLD
ncbi:hypothetical protein GALMADRAFT_136164 [Galerina marginata CBS 339.88]|uniref:Uncharacterized protein n=1 Tax=Galerina marginata (strain CBS 339.88) TaxID=685588 RepID=A0A067TD82_GALM3|nr:hypothetical protein GALMADRAFT_136164 [Galerina marginata CBS 339.88]